MTPPARAALLVVGLCVAVLTPRSHAQELEPRLWSNLPVGANFLGVGYGFSSGNILVDPSLPVEDADAEVDSLSVRYLRTTGVGGLASTVDVLVPLSSGTWEGIVEGEPVKTSRHGMGDPRIRFMVNFVGAPALRRPEFAKFRPGTIAGASLQIILPLGEYVPSKLINLGSNRYTFCPQIGFSHTFERMAVEVTGTAWLFTDNDDFFGGSSLEQDPLYAIQAHLFYTFKPGLWVGFDAGLADGGQTVVDGEPGTSIEKNTRYGVTTSIPIDRRQGFKVAVSTGLSTRIGADFTTYSIGYQYMWGGANEAPTSSRSRSADRSSRAPYSWHRTSRVPGSRTSKSGRSGLESRARSGGRVARVIFTPSLERHVSAPPTEVAGSSVREVLDRVFHDNPLLRGHVLDDRGGLRKQVVVFINGQMIDDRVALTDDIVETDEVFVMQASSG